MYLNCKTFYSFRYGTFSTAALVEMVKATYTCPMHQEVISAAPGNCPFCNAKLVVDRRGSKQGATIYTCSMHPNVTTTKEGKCPICGMTLQQKAAHKDSSHSKM